MNKFVLILCALTCTSCAPKEAPGGSSETKEGSLYVKLYEQDEKIYVEVINGSDSPRRISTRFRTIGSDADLTFEFPDHPLKERSTASRGYAHIAAPGAFEVDLMPRTYVGRFFIKDDIKDNYKLGAGCYRARVKISPEAQQPASPISELTSELTKLCF